MFKSTPFLAFAGASTAGGAGMVGLEVYRTTNPTAEEIFLKGGLKREPYSVDLKVREDIEKGEHEFTFESGTCFNSFFPGATVKHVKSEHGDYYKKKAPLVRVDERESNLMGCASMKLYAESKDRFLFRAEVVARGDNYGWALWVGWKKTGDGPKDRRYQNNLVFLRKSSDDTWFPVGGYAWFDRAWEIGGADVNNINISVHGEEWLPKGSGEPEFPYEVQYAGIWEKDGSSDGEIFQGIQTYWKPNGGDKAVEVLGRGEEQVRFRDGKGGGYGETVMFYSADRGWVKYLKPWTHYGKEWFGMDVSEELDALYSPLSGNRGKWRDMDGYCDERFQSRNLSVLELDLLGGFCYR